MEPQMPETTQTADAHEPAPAAILSPEDTSPEPEPVEDTSLDRFEDENAFPDDAAVEELLREHIRTNYPALRLSDGDVAQLAESIRKFREARAEMQSVDRTNANAPSVRDSLRRTVAAMDEFRRITGMSPDEFFMTDEPPVIFGNMEPPPDDINEMPAEDLSGSTP